MNTYNNEIQKNRKTLIKQPNTLITSNSPDASQSPPPDKKKITAQIPTSIPNSPLTQRDIQQYQWILPNFSDPTTGNVLQEILNTARDLTHYEIVALGFDAFGNMHAQRKLPNGDIQIVHFDPKTQETILARSTVAKTRTLAQLKHLFLKHSQLPDSQTHISPSKIQSTLHTPYKAKTTYQYTATEAHLKLLLGNQYQEFPILFNPETKRHYALHNDIPVEVQDHPDYKPWLESLIKATLSLPQAEINPATIPQFDHYVNQLVQAAYQERIYIDKIPIYHGTDENTGFIYNVITEFRKQLMASANPNTVLMRGIDKFFQEFPSIESFIQKYRKPDNSIDNYSPGYTQAAICANPYLFGSIGVDGSETFRYFLNSFSMSPINPEAILTPFAKSLGIPFDYDSYQKILKHAYNKNIPNGRLFQVFVNPDTIDQIAYSSVVLGTELQFHLPDSPSPSSTQISKAITLLKSNPQSFQNIITNPSSAFKASDPERSLTINSFQQRVLLNPNYITSPDVLSFEYWRINQNQTTYHKALQQKVSEDLALALASKTPITPGTLDNSSTNFQLLKDLYAKLSYPLNSTQPYQEQDFNISLLFEKILDDDHLIRFTTLLKSFGHSILVQKYTLNHSDQHIPPSETTLLQHIFQHQNSHEIKTKTTYILLENLPQWSQDPSTLETLKKSLSGVLSYYCGEQADLKIVKELLKYPDIFDINEKAPISPLMNACNQGNLEIAELLISQKNIDLSEFDYDDKAKLIEITQKTSFLSNIFFQNGAAIGTLFALGAGVGLLFYLYYKKTK